jgi:hypothetical protein
MKKKKCFERFQQIVIKNAPNKPITEKKKNLLKIERLTKLSWQIF